MEYSGLYSPVTKGERYIKRLIGMGDTIEIKWISI